MSGKDEQSLNEAKDDLGASPAAALSRPGISRRRFIGRSAGAALAVGGVGSFLAACGDDEGDGGGSGGGDGATDEVVVLGWDSYVRSEIKDGFEKANPGVRFKGVPAESDQDMFTKLQAGGGGQYDVVWANAGFVPVYVQNDLVELLSIDDFEASKTVYPAFVDNTDLPWVKSPGELYFVPNFWSSYSLVWNQDVFSPGDPVSWKALWDSKLPDNHVMMMGAPDDFIVIAGMALGVPQNEVYSMSGDQLDEAADYLIDLKPFQINASVEPRFRNSLISEKIWAGLATTLGLSARIDEQAGKDVAAFAVPDEGTIGWVDGPMIAKGAKNKANAIKYCNYVTQEAVGFLFDEYQTAPCNKEFVDKTLAAGGEPAQQMKFLEANKPEVAEQIEFQRPPDDASAWAAAWDRVQAS
jgi:spermidine/putrescine transport system substrate-binding protein